MRGCVENAWMFTKKDIDKINKLNIQIYHTRGHIGSAQHRPRSPGGPSESSVRVIGPSHLSESPIRFSVRAAHPGLFVRVTLPIPSESPIQVCPSHPSGSLCPSPTMNALSGTSCPSRHCPSPHVRAVLSQPSYPSHSIRVARCPCKDPSPIRVLSRGRRGDPGQRQGHDRHGADAGYIYI